MANAQPVGLLLPHGYLPVGLVLSDQVAPYLSTEAKDPTYQGVFNKVGGGDDTFRWQSRVQ
ncbi:hypothetical protein F441_11628 [Phytophthora nicotianae CJ01A1]|uniref:Uncharacterized protein n=4 Tax=Phytophthora nicotianae TaxID=4792 RepID=W2Q300_PHYN3|nr:hypothetical protein PPTG_23284 [Phytophthora nicotianae INRA-310]ETK83397.1 hypothetical protein L915_11383 [Phytophthora nicotianae]ETO71998.1 hypothetical protein F444_11776 [Phytophthora nicotianae P1976]ETP13135.1 hypothetical protein F441_11628 [Phytophthora nicotianae CJ01A1]ETL36816.1 hypothetical protein L916_11288 [Phytophthora nicotianae]ETM43269.1 hypothetical protein L914_11223 [Phytophthora nicotianae]